MVELEKYNMKTGDLLLFDSEDYHISGWFSLLIKFFTQSKFSHVGMIVKDPIYIKSNMKG